MSLGVALQDHPQRPSRGDRPSEELQSLPAPTSSLGGGVPCKATPPSKNGETVDLSHETLQSPMEEECSCRAFAAQSF